MSAFHTESHHLVEVCCHMIAILVQNLLLVCSEACGVQLYMYGGVVWFGLVHAMDGDSSVQFLWN